MIELAYKILAKIGIAKHQDKVLHFLGGLIIYLGLVYFLSFISFIGIWAFVVVVVVAVGKEVYDRKTTGFDYYDIAATLLGGWFGMVIWSFIQ
ncbi:MAG: hypothetical protein LHW59_05455 [Candidatus Cloacimonetes bacterium]|nr:hypothetical protein [Candidatus Cloacimonadota bacterium]